MKRFLIFFEILILSGLLAGQSNHLKFIHKYQQKMDGGLQLRLLDDPRQDDVLYPKMVLQDNRLLWPVLIQSSKDIQKKIQKSEGFFGSNHGPISTAYLTLDGVKKLVADPDIVYVEMAQAVKPELNTSLFRNGTSFIHHIPRGNYTGKNVIVGITDSGLDLTHPDFQHSNGKTRVLYLWDQYNNEDGHPPGFNYGTEYTKSEIDMGFRNQRDTGGHGTFVTSIAAGNGSAGPYTGMAPEADLIIVKAVGGMLGNILDPVLNTAGILDGYAYIRTRANQLGKPYVINTSRGTTIGPHDGTTLLSQAVNAEVGLGTILVCSAGNYSNKEWHAEAVAQAGVPVTFEAHFASGENQIYMDFWMEGGDQFKLEIAAPGEPFLPSVSGDTIQTIYKDYARLTLFSRLNSPLNQDNEFLLRINNPLNGSSIRGGEWRFRFTSVSGNDLPAGGEIDGWIIRDVDAQFTNFVDYHESIGEMATSDSAISVASFNNKSSPAGAISSFSSVGPRRDGVLKPDIAAAGGGIVGGLSQQSGDATYQGDPWYSYGSGTSYSAPHVTGAVALLLQQHPEWSAGHIKHFLQRTAKQDDYTGAVPNPEWGYGKLDMINALENDLPHIPVFGAIQIDNQQVNGNMHFAPVYSDDPSLFTDYRLTPQQNSFTDTLLAGVYDLSAVPVLPYSASEKNIGIAADTTDLQIIAETSVADVAVVSDQDKDYARYYTSALDSLGLRFALQQKSDSDVVSLSSCLSKMAYPLVIWFSGDERDFVLNSFETDSLRSFLDNGGKLLLSGQNIAESMNDSAFAENYLGARFAENTQDHLLQTSNNSILDSPKYIYTSGIDGAANQNSSDVLLPVGSSRALAYYDTSESTVAAVANENTTDGWRLIFYGFGLESVTRPQNNEQFLSRESILLNSLNWLADTSIVSSLPRDEWLPQSELKSEKMDFSVFPNPFNSRIQCRYNLKQPSKVEISIYDVLGRQLSVLVDAIQNSGEHTVNWLAERQASGMYFIKIQIAEKYQIRKILQLK